MCLTRIYCLRKRDGVMFRFNSKAAMLAYSRDNRETPHTLPMISRDEFIRRKRTLSTPRWIHSTRYAGMAMLGETT